MSELRNISNLIALTYLPYKFSMEKSLEKLWTDIVGVEMKKKRTALMNILLLQCQVTVAYYERSFKDIVDQNRFLCTVQKMNVFKLI